MNRLFIPKHLRQSYSSRWMVILLIFLMPVTLYSQSFKYTSRPSFVSVGNSSSIAFDADNDAKNDVFIMGKNGTNYYSKLYHNNGDSTFLNLGIPFPGLAYGSVDVLDYNNDGLQDIVLCGFDGTSQRFCLFKNKGHNLFTEVSTNIPGVAYGTIKCADLNRDGNTDIVVMGQVGGQMNFCIYRNLGNGSFQMIKALTGLYDGSMIIADINNDSYPDIIAGGVANSFELISKVYVNSGNDDFSFKERNSGLPALRGGKIENFDFNNDGFTDVLIVGKNSNDEYISQVYRNNSGESFTLFSSLDGLYYSSAATGDFNNDGYPDIFLSGLNQSSVYTTNFYVNNAGANFTLQSESLPKVVKGSISPFDLTSDGKLDFLFTGFAMAGAVSNVYNNNVVSVNSPPAAPFNLTSDSRNDSVLLRWNRPSDAETASKGLTYDFYITKASDGDTVFSSPAVFSTGTRKVFKQGILQDTFLLLKNMPYGKYYWSVQAVDQSYSGSPFASTGEFNICHSLYIGRDSSICQGESIAFSAGSSSDIVKWYSEADPNVSFHNGNNASVVVNRSLKVWATVNTSIGCSLSDTLSLTVLSLPETSLKSDTGICYNSQLSLILANSDYVGDWSSKDHSIDKLGLQSVAFNVVRNDSVFVRITDLNGCVNFDTISITAYSLPVSHLPKDTSVCYKDILKLTAAYDSDSVYWFNSNKELLSKENTIQYPVLSSQYLKVKIVNPLKCVSHDTVMISRLELPVVFAGSDTLVCAGTSAFLGKSAQDGFKYEWTPASTLNEDRIANPEATPQETTEYILKVTDSNFCINYDTVKVKIDFPTTIDVSDKFICKGESVQIGGNPTAKGSLLPYSFYWFPNINPDDSNSANPVVSPDTSTVYYLRVSTGSCILDTVSVKVTVWTLPVISKSDDIKIGYRESAQLWATGGEVYMWEPGLGLSDNSVSNPLASPEATTTYNVYVTDTNGCESSAQVVVIVQNEIFVPNLFTPNGDGKNDNFLVYGTGIDKIRMRIFNTEGILVYETGDVKEATENGWNGNYKGNPLGSGKYLWVIDAISTNGSPLLYNNSNKGVVTLIR